MESHADLEDAISMVALHYSSEHQGEISPNSIKTNWNPYIIEAPQAGSSRGLWAIRYSIQAQHPNIQTPDIEHLAKLWHMRDLPKTNRPKIVGWAEDSVMLNIDLLARVLNYWGRNYDLDLVLGVLRDNRAPYRHETPTTTPEHTTVWVHYGGQYHCFSGLKRNSAASTPSAPSSPPSHLPLATNVTRNVPSSLRANDLLPTLPGTSGGHQERQHTAFETYKGSPSNRNSSLQKPDGTTYEREIQKDNRRFGTNDSKFSGALTFPSNGTRTNVTQRQGAGAVGSLTKCAPSAFAESKRPSLAAPKSHVRETWWRTSAHGVGTDTLKDLTPHHAVHPSNQTAAYPPSHSRQEVPGISLKSPQTNLIPRPLLNNNNYSTVQDELPETLRRANERQGDDTLNWHPVPTTSMAPVLLGESEFGYLRRLTHRSKIVVEGQDERGLRWYPVDDALIPSGDEVRASHIVAELRRTDLDLDAFDAVLRENRARLHQRQIQGQNQGQQQQQVEDAQHRFLCALLRRCCYITAFAEHHHRHRDRPGHKRENEKERMLASLSGIYPLLGPDPELDHFVLDRGLLPRVFPGDARAGPDPGSGAPRRRGRMFDPDTHPLVRMYGFGPRELRWMRWNTDEDERAVQWDTILRYHALQAWIGPGGCADVKETLEFAFYRLRDSRKARAYASSLGGGAGGARRPWAAANANLIAARFCRLRRLEFDVAALLVDRLWRDVRANHGLRTIPFVVRKQQQQQQQQQPQEQARPYPSLPSSSRSHGQSGSESSVVGGDGDGNTKSGSTNGAGSGDSGSFGSGRGDWDALPARTQWELLGLPRTWDLARKYADLMKEPFSPAGA